MATEFRLFSDYTQIEFYADGSQTELGDFWADFDNPLHDYLALAEDAVAVLTGVNGYVQVVVEVTDGPPSDDRAQFATVTECSVRAESGRLRVTSPTYGEDDGDRVDVPAGWLRLRISLSLSPVDEKTLAADIDDPDPARGQRIRVQCWPAPPAAPVLLKGWDHATQREVERVDQVPHTSAG